MRYARMNVETTYGIDGPAPLVLRRTIDHASKKYLRGDGKHPGTTLASALEYLGNRWCLAPGAMRRHPYTPARDPLPNMAGRPVSGLGY